MDDNGQVIWMCTPWGAQCGYSKLTVSYRSPVVSVMSAGKGTGKGKGLSGW